MNERIEAYVWCHSFPFTVAVVAALYLINERHLKQFNSCVVTRVMFGH